jgi:type IV pilus assembly protein PilM
MARRVVGLDIGTSAVRAVELSVGGGRPVILAFGQVSLPRGAVVDGEVMERGTVTDALKRLWRQGRFRQSKVSVSIAGLRAITRDLDMPVVPDHEVDSAVRFQAGELLPFPVDQTILSSQVLGTFEGSDGQPKMHVLVAAAHEDLVGSIVGAILDAGLVPESVDLASSAIVRAVAGPRPAPDPEAVVSVGAGMTIVTVHRQGSPDFVRTIGQGGNAVTDAISSTLGVPQNDAEVLKRRIGEPFPNLAEVEAATHETLGVLVGEIRSSLDYYATLPGRRAVSHVLLTGGGSRLPSLRTRLEAQVGVPVFDASPLSHLDLSRLDLDQSEIALLDTLMAVPVGSALPEIGHGVHKFNLLPPEVGRRVSERALRRRLVMAGLTAVAVMVLGSGLRAVEAHSAQSQANSIKLSNSELNVQITRYDDVIRTNLAIKSAGQKVLSAVGKEVSWTTVLDQLSRSIPADVYLTSFNGQVVQPGSAPPGTVQGPGSTSSSPPLPANGLPPPSAVLASVNVQGQGPAYGGGAQWITQMNSSPAFANTYITTISSGQGGSGASGQVSFSSTFSVTGAAHSTRFLQFQKEAG